jgi:thiol-disulfide isomerase/thioredoxin
MRSIIYILTLFVMLGCSRNDISSNTAPDRNYGSSRIYGSVHGLPGSKVFLYKLYGDQVSLLDSAMSSFDGSFEFLFPRNRNNGLYRLALGNSGRTGLYDRQTPAIDIIWDGSTVVFSTHYGNPADSMKIIVSEQNELYYKFLDRMDDFDQKIGVLSTALIDYPESGSFSRRLKREYRRVQNRRSNYIDNLVKKNEGTVFASIASFYKLPAIDSPGSDAELTELKTNFFGKDQLADPVLLHTDLVPRKILRYLALYTGSGYDADEQEYELVDAVDVIMQQTMKNEEVFYYVLEFLINGFDGMEMDLVADHLRSRYLLGDVCFEEGVLRDQVLTGKGKEAFSGGDVVPGFNITSLQGKNINLADINARHTLLVFWGSWCPHCEGVMEDLLEIYNDYNNSGFLEIIAIGIEDDREMWLAEVEDKKHPWISYSSFQKWDCPLARDFNINGTPTMILLDSDKKFLQEPLRVRTLDRYLARQLRQDPLAGN